MIYESRFLIALAGTSLIEVPLVFALVKYVFKIKNIGYGKVILIAFLASVLTLPYLWFILPPYVDARYYVLTGEFLVFLIESFLYWQALKVKIWHGLLISLVANSASYFLGPILISLL